MNGTMTLTELSARYDQTAACLTAQIQALLLLQHGLEGKQRRVLEGQLITLRAMRRESLNTARYLKNYYHREAGRHETI